MAKKKSRKFWSMTVTRGKRDRFGKMTATKPQTKNLSDAKANPESTQPKQKQSRTFVNQTASSWSRTRVDMQSSNVHVHKFTVVVLICFALLRLRKLQFQTELLYLSYQTFLHKGHPEHYSEIISSESEPVFDVEIFILIPSVCD